MKRSELIDTVNRAAISSGLIAAHRAAIVAAVSNPSVTRVAAGVYLDDVHECMCPAALAFGYLKAESSTELGPFANSFDALVMGENRTMFETAVIEIEEDA